MFIYEKMTGHNDIQAAASLALELWPDNSIDEFSREYSELLNEPDAAVFLAYSQETPAGFAQCQLRCDYVEGTESSPVGYLEGIFVKEDYRKRGIAKQLLKECENWARGKGCTEFASDCELTNVESLHFHLNLGFEEANRIICFTKKL